MAKVVWTEKASDHLQAIYEYIAHDSAVYAERFVRTLVKSTVKLESMPNCGRVVPEFNNAKLLEVIFQNYRIVYRVINNHRTIEILAVVHCARDFSRLPDIQWELL